jgi:hypothetical protein
MNPLFVNHKEYIEKMKRNDFEHYEMIKTSEINDRVNNWNNGNKQIGKINIR